MIHEQSITGILKALDEKQYSCVELVNHYLQRLQDSNGEINAFISITTDQALSHAKKLDKARMEGNAPPLAGIPIAHKDIFCTRGIKTSAGSHMLDNFIAPYDATVVEKLNDAGAIILGKTNMDEFAMGSSNENSYYGRVQNPWSKDSVPGGSSGGSAFCSPPSWPQSSRPSGLRSRQWPIPPEIGVLHGRLHQGRQERFSVDPIVVPQVPRRCRLAPASRPGLQPG